jgi:preprotein translocase subunit SecE
VARNRKRPRERRPRRPSEASDSQQGLPTATESDFDDGLERNGAPDPIEHGTPDVELANAQLAYGRPDEPEPGDAADEEEFEREVEDAIDDVPAQASGRGGRGYDGGGAVTRRGAGEPRPAHAEERENLLVRLVGFLQGSWRELQRVQWPDRRQVMQATSVVIGFVIVAAAFLGVADFVAGKIVTFVLK